MKLGIKDRLKVAMTGEIGIDDYTKKWFSGDDIDNPYIDSHKAMKYSSFNACIRIRAETFASVPLILYKKNDGGRKPITNELIYDVLHYQPNEEMAPFNFYETMLTNFDTGGNLVGEKLYNSRGQIVGVYPYKHSIVRIERNSSTRKLEYHITDGTQKRTLSRQNVIHIPNLSFDGVVGLSPISYAAQTIQLGLSYEKFGVNFYKNAATPSGAFGTAQRLSEPGYERLKKALKENYTGMKNAGTPMLLEEGLNWQQITINPADAQLIESKNFQVEDICRIYRVPQHMVGKLDRSTNNNIEHQSLEFIMYTMLPIYKRFESNMTNQLLTLDQRRKGLYVEFKMDGLLRGDMKSRAEAYAKGRQWGWLSVNDIRRTENLPPIENGNIYLQPLNYVEAGKFKEAYDRMVEKVYNMLKKEKEAA